MLDSSLEQNHGCHNHLIAQLLVFEVLSCIIAQDYLNKVAIDYARRYRFPVPSVKKVVRREKLLNINKIDSHTSSSKQLKKVYSPLPGDDQTGPGIFRALPELQIPMGAVIA
jgi:hypothetical protein